MDYRIIRAAEDYGLIIVISPADATAQSETAKYYRYATWKIDPDHEPDRFHAVSRNIAWGYFSGHADGLGFGSVPDQSFPSLDAILKYCAWEKNRTPSQRLLAEFHQLLIGAYLSSETEDSFDLDSAQLDSKQKFREIHRRASLEAIKLVRYCQMHGKTLIDELMPSDLTERAKLRPVGYARMSPHEQWIVDRQLGILDWDGS